MKYLTLLVLLIMATACAEQSSTHYRVRATCLSSNVLMDSVAELMQNNVMRVKKDKTNGSVFGFSTMYDDQKIERTWKIFRNSDTSITYECRETRSWTQNTARIGQPANNVHIVIHKYLIDENADEENKVYWKVRKFLMDRCSNFEVFTIDCDPDLDIKIIEQ